MDQHGRFRTVVEGSQPLYLLTKETPRSSEDAPSENEIPIFKKKKDLHHIVCHYQSSVSQQTFQETQTFSSSERSL